MDETPDTRLRRRRSILGKRERRSILLFFVASAVAAVLVVGAALLRKTPTLILPPEPAEETAMRTADGNAYSYLERAVSLLPKAPPPLVAQEEDNAGFVGMYMPAQGSIGHLLGVGRPDDDPELVAFIAEAGPALDAMHDALNGEYFRLPTPEVWKYAEILGRVPMLALISLADARLDLQTDPSRAQTAAVTDVLHLGTLIAQDGGFGGYAHGVSVQNVAAKQAWSAALEIIDPEHRDETIDAWEELSLARGGLRSALEYEWRILDRPDAFWILSNRPERANAPARHPGEVIERIMIGRQFERLRQHVIAHREAYLEAADMPWPGSEEWNRLYRRLTGARTWFDPMDRLGDVQRNRATIDAWLHGWRIVAHIESFRAANGLYPAQLTDLNMEVNDPLTKEPYVYRAYPEDYTLYSVGLDMRDNEGDAWQDRDLVFRRSANEPPQVTDPRVMQGLAEFGRRDRRR